MINNKYAFDELFKDIRTEYVSIYNVTDDYLMYDKQGEYEIFPASITKVMNALTTLKYANVKDEFVVGEEQDIMWMSPDPSLAHIKKGEKWKMEDLLYASLLPSGNDAAYALGYNTVNQMKEYKDKTVKEKCDIFARLMNEYAKELGCKNTSFVTLDGNDYVNKKIVPHLTTTNDLCLIFKEALNNPVLSKVMGTHKKEIVVGSEKYSFTNGDDLINPESKYYNKMVLGGKTGMTCPAGYCLGSFAKIRNKYFIVIACYAYVNENKYIDSNKIYNFLYNLTEKTPKGVRE